MAEADPFIEDVAAVESALDNAESFLSMNPGWVLANLDCLDPTFIDKDGDGYNGCGEDCDDENPSIYPNAPEFCDGITTDCLNVWYGADELRFIERDKDGDGAVECEIVDGGWLSDGNPISGDCDDTDSSSTAREYDLEVNSAIDERYHLEKSTQFACDYLNKAYSIFGSWTMAAASYNMGMNGLKRTIEKQKTKNYYNLHLNSETSRYIFRILAIKEIIENPIIYGFIYDEEDLYHPIPVRNFSVDTGIVDLSKFAKTFNINYKILKIHNSWLRQNHLINRSRKKYFIEIPEEGYY